MGYGALFFRLIVRPMIRDKGRSALVLFAVALGVGVVLAIDLAGDAAAGSFHSSMESLTGDNDLEVTAAGGVPEAVVARLATLPEPIRETPRIEDHATVVANGETIPLIGVDLIAEANQRDAQLADASAESGFEHINDADAIWTNRGLCAQAGCRIKLLINDQQRVYTVRGLLPQGERTGGDVILMDIGAAQQATGKRGAWIVF